MRINSNRRTVTIEEHSIQLDKTDLAEMIEIEQGEEGTGVNARDLTVVVTHESVDGTTSFGATQILEIARSIHNEIPEDAEVVLALRWKREEETPTAPTPIQRLVAADGLTPPQNATRCPTCDGTPYIDGPTPDCHDESGCGLVRREKGEIVIPKAIAAANSPVLMKDSLTPPPGMMVNRETGQRAFMAKDGTPYGVHDDYRK